MLIKYGWFIDGQAVELAEKEYPDADVVVMAEQISSDYLVFKEVIDKYGNDTYLATPTDRHDLRDAIDSHLDPILDTIVP